MLLGDIAKLVGGLVTGGSDAERLEINRIMPIKEAGPGDITFLTNPEYTRYLADCRASAVIVQKPLDEVGLPQLVHKNPYWAFAKVAQCFEPEKQHGPDRREHAIIDASAVVDKTAIVYPFVYIEGGATVAPGAVLYPGVYVGRGASVGQETIIYPHCFIGDRCQIGERVIMHAGTVVGADGFGFAPGADSIAKIPQTGVVIIEDDVELGGVCTVDRAAFGATEIGSGCKLDSKVHVGHNVKIGRNCMFSALTGIAGSTTIGDWVVTGGHSGISGHLHVHDGVKVGAMTGVVQKTEPGETYMGFPGTPAKEWKRTLVHQKRLSDYAARLKSLEAELKALKQKLEL